jgi:hypothetical protein
MSRLFCFAAALLLAAPKALSEYLRSNHWKNFFQCLDAGPDLYQSEFDSYGFKPRNTQKTLKKELLIRFRVFGVFRGENTIHLKLHIREGNKDSKGALFFVLFVSFCEKFLRLRA